MLYEPHNQARVIPVHYVTDVPGGDLETFRRPERQPG